ncbi:uncharacterized protein WCC33_000943 [Rhinophrynus dorsalis]
MGLKWEGQFYVDKCLPMGCAISCAYFEAFSTFLHWAVADRAGVGEIAHYLDDFLFIGPPGSPSCGILLESASMVFSELGVPIAQEKTVGPATCFSFLGIEIDTVAQEARLPKEKVEKARDLLVGLRGRNKVTLRELQSVLGLLNFACRVIPMGRVFSRRLQMATAGVKKPQFKIRLTKQLQEDLKVWDQFLSDFNGTRLWVDEGRSNQEMELFTDAAGGVGFGAYLKGKWCAGRWPGAWELEGLTRNLAFLELFPIFVALELWHEEFANKAVIFWTDNMSVVFAINLLTSSSPPVLGLLRRVVLLCMRHNILFKAKHVPGVDNRIADALSREKWGEFFKLAPAARPNGIVCPSTLWQLAATY